MLRLAVAAQHMDELVLDHLLDVGPGGLQILAGVELVGVLGKELADGTVFPVRLRPAIPPRAVGACWLCAMELSGAAKEFLRLLEDGAPPVPQM